MTRERPILMSGPMVRAVLDGRKSITRRVVKPEPPEWVSDIVTGLYHPTEIIQGEEEPGPETFGAYDAQTGEWTTRCPYGAPGDRLWVRENWQADFGHTFSDHERALWHEMPRSLRTLKAVQQGMGMLYYAADRSVYHAPTPEQDEFGPEVRRSTWEPTDDFWAELPWRPSIHMPRWASRISLEVTEVRVERLQEITEDDVLAEGATWGVYLTREQRISEFANLWNKLNAARGYGWDANPWVWIIRFRRLTP